MEINYRISRWNSKQHGDCFAFGIKAEQFEEWTPIPKSDVQAIRDACDSFLDGRDEPTLIIELASREEEVHKPCQQVLPCE